MSEKMYKTVANAGIFNLVLGILILVSGIASGVLLVVNGAKLIKSKKTITF